MSAAAVAQDVLQAAQKIETGELAARLAAVPPASLAGVDEALRGPGVRAAWAGLHLAAAIDARSWEALALAACHPDGRVRQAALVEIAHLGDGRVIPFLLLRLNDVVPAVRATARAALLSYMTTEYAPHFRDARPVVDALLRKTRTDLTPVHAWISRLLGDGQADQRHG